MAKKDRTALPHPLPEGGPLEVRGEDFVADLRKMLDAPAMPLPPRKGKPRTPKGKKPPKEAE